MKILIFDLETTGLPKQPGWDCYYPYEQLPHYDSARIVQIGLMVCTYEVGKELQVEKEFNLIIKPVGFKINNASFHGITHQLAEQKGIDFEDAIDALYEHFRDASLLVAHNILFDRTIMQSELYRHKMPDELKLFSKIPTFCTSRGCADITKLKRKKSNNFKQPKLIELYKYLFGKLPDEKMHDAIADTHILAKCYFELIKRGLIKLDNMAKK